MQKNEVKVRSLKDDIVFTSQAGTKIGKCNLIRTFAQALEMADIEGFIFHCLRHTFATRLAQNGVDIYKIASSEDKAITEDLVFAGRIMKIKVLDHIIIGEEQFFSFADEGLIKRYNTNYDMKK